MGDRNRVEVVFRRREYWYCGKEFLVVLGVGADVVQGPFVSTS